MTLLIDTLQASETLRDAGFKKKEAEALIKALSPAASDVVNQDRMQSGLNKLKAELITWMIGLQIAAVSLLVVLLG